MFIQPLWSRNLHQTTCDVIVNKGFLYVSERANYISKIEINSGKVIWSKSKLKNENLASLGFSGWFSNYVPPERNICVLSGWSGYGYLSSYEFSENSRKIIWSLNNNIETQSIRDKIKEIRLLELNNIEKLKLLWKKILYVDKIDYPKYSETVLLENDLFLIVNYTLNKIEIRELMTGKLFNILDLPEKIKYPRFRLPLFIDGKITWVSSDGKIYSLSTDYKILNCKKLNIDYIESFFPFFFNDGLIYESAQGIFNLYRCSSEKVIWSIKMDSNCSYRPISVNQLAHDTSGAHSES